MFKYLVIFGVLVSAAMSSCTVNSHLMLKTPKDFVFDSIPENSNDQYAITPGDQLQFRLYSNGGFAVIDMASGKGGGNTNAIMRTMNITYLVKPDGNAYLPVLGDVQLVGMTIIDAQTYLEELYAEYYVDPFLQLNVANKKVIVFPGSGSNAQWITLQQNSVTLLEVLAQVGGITKESKAKSVKVMRVVEGKEEREVYLIDLSTIDGLKDGDMILQADDIVYVQPNANIAREVLQDVSPIITVISSTIVFYLTLKNFVN